MSRPDEKLRDNFDKYMSEVFWKEAVEWLKSTGQSEKLADYINSLLASKVQEVRIDEVTKAQQVALNHIADRGITIAAVFGERLSELQTEGGKDEYSL